MEVAKRAGNFLPQLQHPQSPLGLVVLEGNGKIVHENENVMRVISREGIAVSAQPGRRTKKKASLRAIETIPDEVSNDFSEGVAQAKVILLSDGSLEDLRLDRTGKHDADLLEMIRYDWFYSNKARGIQRKKETSPCIAWPKSTPPPPLKLPKQTWRDLIYQAWSSQLLPKNGNKKP